VKYRAGRLRRPSVLDGAPGPVSSIIEAGSVEPAPACAGATEGVHSEDVCHPRRRIRGGGNETRASCRVFESARGHHCCPEPRN
jgi:hypothetical protein